MVKRIIRIIKMIGLSVLAIVAVLVIVGLLFVNLSPQFGGSISEEEKERYSQSPQFVNGKFQNNIHTTMDMNFSSMTKIMGQYIKGIPNSRPSFELPVIPRDSLEIVQNKTVTRLVWFGHSAFLLQLNGKNILLDPMLGDVPAPHPMLGRKRYSKELPIEIEKLPQIDAIIFSHDHYDHLDYGSIEKLKGKTKEFFVPLGVGAHLREWGIEGKRIQEFDWWEETDFEGIKLIFTPSRHFSGRGVTDRFSTLWGSWVIQRPGDSIFFSGDGGYGPHFREIGEKYGPFDFAMIECGQYNENWKDIHMMPEESAQAAVDLNAKVMMPIHWGAFTLALHSWTDPVERVLMKARQLDMPIVIPKIGEEITWSQDKVANTDWWVGKE